VANILYGKPVSEYLESKIKETIKNIESRLSLAIFLVGDRPDSHVYVNKKKDFGLRVGIDVEVFKFDKDIKQDELEKKLVEVINDKKNDGIMIQLPLPEHIDSKKILNTIPKEKDVDGLSDSSLVPPATACAVFEILKFYNIEYKSKKVSVIGKSKIAGLAIANILKDNGAVVDSFDIETPHDVLVQGCKNSEIVVSAVGKIGLVTKDFVASGQTIIDVGINKDELSQKIVGDVVFDEVSSIVSNITPVPLGVGPVTVACLFQNLVNLCYDIKHNSLS
jgi:methylenetetrahydrofolate dehydrogenase (NADP+)/methenyltetrahydrofolate cyclohydrolase